MLIKADHVVEAGYIEDMATKATFLPLLETLGLVYLQVFLHSFSDAMS
jgi:hypothetical protein